LPEVVDITTNETDIFQLLRIQQKGKSQRPGMDIKSNHLMLHSEQVLDHPTPDTALSTGHKKTVSTHASEKEMRMNSLERESDLYWPR
jgi:hypothetical protein